MDIVNTSEVSSIQSKVEMRRRAGLRQKKELNSLKKKKSLEIITKKFRKVVTF